MAHVDRRFSVACTGVLFLALLCAGTAAAQGGLQTINPPQGGKIVFGQVTGQNTEAGAMGAVLRSLHSSLGDRPQVGKLFQVRGTESVAAFFSVTRRNGDGGHVAGLLIAAKATSDHVEAALVTDDAKRFPKTLGPMMKTLMGTWHPLQTAVASGPGAAAAPLHQVTLSDGSASISLPDGWQLAPKMSMMGSLVARGPNGESAEMGITFLAGDTNNPRIQQLMRTLRNGGLRNTMYATATYYPYGADPAKTFVDLIQNIRRKAGLSPANYNFSSVTRVPGNGQERCTRLAGTVDFNDGVGQRELNAVYCTSPPGPAGTWMSSAYMTSVPAKFAARERTTLGAVMQSFNVNMRVVQGQAARLAAPAIQQIHAIGEAAAAQAKSAHEREDIHNSSVYQHWDSLDKRSQEFENYQLGYSVISDSQGNAHGTLWNDDAAALVQSDPNRFEYVSAPNYWKGIDY